MFISYLLKIVLKFFILLFQGIRFHHMLIKKEKQISSNWLHQIYLVICWISRLIFSSNFVNHLMSEFFRPSNSNLKVLLALKCNKQTETKCSHTLFFNSASSSSSFFCLSWAWNTKYAQALKHKELKHNRSSLYSPLKFKSTLQVLYATNYTP